MQEVYPNSPTAGATGIVGFLPPGPIVWGFFVVVLSGIASGIA